MSPTLVDTLGCTLMIPLLPAVVKEYGAADVMVGALERPKERAGLSLLEASGVTSRPPKG